MSQTDKLLQINGLEYWLVRPFNTVEDRERPYVKNTIEWVQSLQTASLYSEEFNSTLQKIEEAFNENRMRYSHIERKQIQKAITAMKGTVLSRIISKRISPVANKAAETVVPVLRNTLNNTVLPATDKTLRFLTKVFVKKKPEVESESE